jgi:signal transduction histidine kinase/ActR/RegA family two-component response regulator
LGLHGRYTPWPRATKAVLEVKLNRPMPDPSSWRETRPPRPVWTLGVRGRLVLLVLVTAIPLIGFALALVVSQSRGQEQQLRDQASRIAGAAMSGIDREVTGVIAGLQVLAASPSLDEGDLRAFDAQARSAVGIAGNSVIILYDANGNRLVSTAAPYGQPLPRRTDMSVIGTPFRTGRPYVTGLFISATMKQPSVGVLVPVLRGGQVRYVLGSGLQSSRLSALMTGSGLSSQWVAAVLDEEGTIIARTRGASEYVGTKALPDVWARIQAQTQPSGSVEGLTKEGQRAMLAFARSGSSGWNTVVAIPRAALDQSLRRWLTLALAAGASVLLVAGLLGLWALRQITRPVEDMMQAAKALEQGQPVEPLATGVEQFDRLGAAMGHAGRAIREREGRLSENIEELGQAHRQLREQDAQKDVFIATLAHELRNPLSPLRTGVQILGRNPPPQVASRTLGMMERQLAHMVRLIDDLLDVSRIARGKLLLRKEDVDLRKVVADAVEAAQADLNARGQAVTLDLPPEPVVAQADVARVSQVLVNLLHNAAKFSPPGGTVRVRLAPAGEHAEIAVSDEGIGIRPEQLDRIFDLFYQVGSEEEGARSGLGIGLSLARRLIELHGGELQAHSEGVGRGATFSVRLPRVAQAAPTVEAAPPAVRGQGLRVLVVDDNRDAAEAMATLLALEGHTVRVEHDGPSALGAAGESPMDVVFLDIGMPGMDGYEVCRRLRQTALHTHTRIVALTGWGAASDRDKAGAAGFDLHLTKPVAREDLEQALYQDDQAPTSRALLP